MRFANDVVHVRAFFGSRRVPERMSYFVRTTTAQTVPRTTRVVSRLEVWKPKIYDSSPRRFAASLFQLCVVERFRPKFSRIGVWWTTQRGYPIETCARRTTI